MPDPKLQAIREEIKAVLLKHDVAGVVILSSPTHMEFIVQLEATWTAIREQHGPEGVGIRFRLTDADVPDEKQRHQLAHDTIGTLTGTIDVMNNLCESLTGLLESAGQKIEFSHISRREWAPR